MGWCLKHNIEFEVGYTYANGLRYDNNNKCIHEDKFYDITGYYIWNNNDIYHDIIGAFTYAKYKIKAKKLNLDCIPYDKIIIINNFSIDNYIKTKQKLKEHKEYKLLIADNVSFKNETIWFVLENERLQLSNNIASAKRQAQLMKEVLPKEETEVKNTNPVLLNDIIFLNNVDFQYCIFETSTTFENTLFLGTINFKGSKFNSKVYFEKAIFKGKTDFEGTCFHDDAYFREAKFYGELYFTGAKFLKQANFGYCAFEKRAKFNVVSFGEVTYFVVSYFMQSADFTEAIFNGTTHFSDVIFKEKLFFKNTTAKIFYFNEIKIENIFYLANVNIDKLILGRINFIDNNFTRENNDYTHLDKYFNQLKLKDKNIISNFRYTCRLLKQTYQEQKNFIDSNIWYALEMKVFGKELYKDKTKRGQRFIFWFNNITNKHGQSFFRPVMIILLLGVIAGIIDFLCLKTWYLSIDTFTKVVFPFKDIFKEGIKIGSIKELFIACFKLITSIMYWLIYRSARQNSKRGF